MVMDEVTKDVEKGVAKKLLSADDLARLLNNWKEVKSRYSE